MSNVFSQKKVYHSFIKKRSSLVIKFNGEPRQSDFSEDWMIYFDIRGDPEGAYYYHIENDAILEQLRGVEKDVWFLVTAIGQGESATLELGEPTKGADVERSGTTRATSRATEDSYFSESLASDYLAALIASQEVVTPVLIEGKDLTDEAVCHLTKDIASSLFIQFYRQRGLFRITDDQKLPLSLDEDSESYSPATDDHFSIIRDTVNELARKNGTAHDGKKLKPALDAILAFCEDGGSQDDAVKIIKWVGVELDHQMAGQEREPDDLPQDELPF
jgi:hypothetical protein